MLDVILFILFALVTYRQGVLEAHIADLYDRNEKLSKELIKVLQRLKDVEDDR